MAERQTEATNEYEMEKKDIYDDIDDKETHCTGIQREIRNRTIDLEVELKRVVADEERVKDASQREK